MRYLPKYPGMADVERGKLVKAKSLFSRWHPKISH